MPEDAVASHLGLLRKRVSGGRVAPFITQLVRDRTLEPEEIAKLKRLIAQAEALSYETLNSAASK